MFLHQMKTNTTFNNKLMKIKFLTTVAVVAVVGLASCGGGEAKLAGELAGTWKGNTAMVMKGKMDKPDKDGKHKPDKEDKHKGGDRDKAPRGDGGEMTCTPTLTFVKTDGTNGGTLNISADYTVSRGVETTSVTTPVKATVNGNVKASGTWTVKDDDEVIVTLDPSNTVVNIDTTSLALSYAKLTDAPQDSLNTIKGRVAANITDVIKPMIATRVQKMRKFDDVKITGNTMTLEAGHNKMTFTKQ